MIGEAGKAGKKAGGKGGGGLSRLYVGKVFLYPNTVIKQY